MVQLKVELRRQGLQISGTKKELIARLENDEQIILSSGKQQTVISGRNIQERARQRHDGISRILRRKCRYVQKVGAIDSTIVYNLSA